MCWTTEGFAKSGGFPMSIEEVQRRLRGNDEYRIIWKAGCLETCTSGLGLGPGCNSTAYTTRRWREYASRFLNNGS